MLMTSAGGAHGINNLIASLMRMDPEAGGFVSLLYDHHFFPLGTPRDKEGVVRPTRQGLYGMELKNQRVKGSDTVYFPVGRDGQTLDVYSDAVSDSQLSRVLHHTDGYETLRWTLPTANWPRLSKVGAPSGAAVLLDMDAIGVGTDAINACGSAVSVGVGALFGPIALEAWREHAKVAERIDWLVVAAPVPAPGSPERSSAMDLLRFCEDSAIPLFWTQDPLNAFPVAAGFDGTYLNATPFGKYLGPVVWTRRIARQAVLSGSPDAIEYIRENIARGGGTARLMEQWLCSWSRDPRFLQSADAMHNIQLCKVPRTP